MAALGVRAHTEWRWRNGNFVHKLYTVYYGREASVSEKVNNTFMSIHFK